MASLRASYSCGGSGARRHASKSGEWQRSSRSAVAANTGAPSKKARSPKYASWWPILTAQQRYRRNGPAGASAEMVVRYGRANGATGAGRGAAREPGRASKVSDCTGSRAPMRAVRSCMTLSLLLGESSSVGDRRTLGSATKWKRKRTSAPRDRIAARRPSEEH